MPNCICFAEKSKRSRRKCPSFIAYDSDRYTKNAHNAFQDACYMFDFCRLYGLNNCKFRERVYYNKQKLIAVFTSLEGPDMVHVYGMEWNSHFFNWVQLPLFLPCAIFVISTVQTWPDVFCNKTPHLKEVVVLLLSFVVCFLRLNVLLGHGIISQFAIALHDVPPKPLSRGAVFGIPYDDVA
jgi:hypothetical protein